MYINQIKKRSYFSESFIMKPHYTPKSTHYGAFVTSDMGCVAVIWGNVSCDNYLGRFKEQK